MTLMGMSSVKPEAGREVVFDALSMTQKTSLIEFAAIIIFLLKFKEAYLPDYALAYIDKNTDFSGLYGDEEKVGIMRQRSSLMRSKSRGNSKDEETKEPVKILGKGKKQKDFVDLSDPQYDDYYEESQTYKKEEVEYYDEEAEDENRMLIERNIEKTHLVEQPEDELL